MFHHIPPRIKQRMLELEQIDARDRQDGTPRQQRLRQIPPESGRFLAILCAGAPPGKVLEVGTSAGYSSLWLSLACPQRGDRLFTFERLEDKAELARQTFQEAGLTSQIELINGDARSLLGNYTEIAFCFLDAEKEHYPGIYDLVVPNLVSGGLLVADNMLSHAEIMRPFIEKADADTRVDALVVGVGKGLLLCRKL
jgi:predicted O-methyltransferase YrrM